MRKEVLELLAPSTYLGMVGRRVRDAEKVKTLLQQGPVILRGPWGSGKTAIANYVATESNLPVFYTRLSQATNKVPVFVKELASHLTGNERGDPLSAEKHLIIVDNVPSKTKVWEFLLTLSERHRVLALTHGGSADGFTTYEIDSYSQDEIYEIVLLRRKISGVNFKDTELRKVAELSHGDAFTAVISLYYMYERNLPVKEAVNRAFMLRFISLTDTERDILLGTQDGFSVAEVTKALAGKYTRKWISMVLRKFTAVGMGVMKKEGKSRVWRFTPLGRAVRQVGLGGEL